MAILNLILFFLLILLIGYLVVSHRLWKPVESQGTAEILSRILSAIPESIIVTNEKFQIFFTNDLAEQKFHLKYQKGKKVSFMEKLKVQTDLDIPQLCQKIFELEAGAQLQQEYAWKEPDSERNQLLVIANIYNNKEQHTGYIFTVMDLTHIKQQQKALAAYAEKLEASNSEMESFTYVASHDLKTPLRNVITYLGLIKNKMYNGDYHNIEPLIDHASDFAKKMHQLIEDLLQLPKINHSDLHHAVDLNEVLREAQSHLEYFLTHENAVVNYSKLPTVKGNVVLLTKLFQNLIENGFKYNHSAQPTVHINFKQGGEFTEFIVRDNGIGIEEAYHNKIFEMFKRLHSQNKYKGTGLGLAICKKIVEKHGGQIWVESIPEEGSAFHFTLPQVTDALLEDGNNNARNTLFDSN